MKLSAPLLELNTRVRWWLWDSPHRVNIISFFYSYKTFNIEIFLFSMFYWVSYIVVTRTWMDSLSVEMQRTSFNIECTKIASNNLIAPKIVCACERPTSRFDCIVRMLASKLNSLRRVSSGERTVNAKWYKTECAEWMMLRLRFTFTEFPPYQQNGKLKSKTWTIYHVQ